MTARMNRKSLCLSLLALSAPFSALALAQSNEPQTIQSDELEVISITANKQDLALDQTPDSVSVLNAQNIKAIAPVHIEQVLAQIPGTWISRGNGQEHLTAIRSPVLTGAGGCGAFFMGVDGISIRAPGFCNANQLFDVNYEQAARIEVLRSPSSTLYGANAMHGVINIISPDAFDAQNNSVALQFGGEDFARLSGVYSQQTNSKAFLVQSNISQENGYQDNSGYDQQKLSAVYQTRGLVWDSKTLLEVSNLNQETAGYISGFNSYKDEAQRKINPNPEAYRDVKALRAYSAFSRNTSYGKLALTPYIRSNSMAFLQHYLPWQALEENSHNSLGLQSSLRFESSNIQWLVGADADYTQGELKETQEQGFSPSIPQGVHYDYEVDATQLALYAQGTWTHNNWQIRFGARAEQNVYDYNNQTNSTSACDVGVALCRFTRPNDQRKTFNAISPNVNVSYNFNENLQVYAKYSQGFRAPQASELFKLQNNQTISSINNENMDALESGFRWSKLNTQVHGAVYTMLKKDGIYQDTQRQNVSGAKTRHQGAELEIKHQFNQHWDVSGHVSYARHTYNNNPQLVNSDILGNEIDTAPKWMSQLNLRYKVAANLQAQLSYKYLGEYYLDPQNTAMYDGHQLVDLHIDYKLSSQVNLGLHVLNLSNKAYAERADYAFGSYRYFVGQTRRAFINLQWIF